MKLNHKFIGLFTLAILLGLLIAWIDNSPNWDDTGITALLIALVAGLISFFYPSRPIIWAVAVSCWIPVIGIIKSGNFSLLLILIFGFIGAYLGLFIHKLIFKRN